MVPRYGFQVVEWTLNPIRKWLVAPVGNICSKTAPVVLSCQGSRYCGSQCSQLPKMNDYLSPVGMNSTFPP